MPPHPQEFDPDPIIAAVLRGDTDRFRLLVREYGLLVRGFLATRMYYKEDVEDLAQDVFVIVFEKLNGYQPGSNLRSWLIGIARFELNNYLRKSRRRANAMERFREEMVEAIELELDTEHESLQRENVERLLDCISRLSDRARHIVRTGLEGARAEDLCEELGMSANAIYQERFRAHACLKKCMTQMGPDMPGSGA
ncbi:MAG: RNA polymerase sigma-70 factor (ECF subfamily) [Akkermansiaceae bacterium]|jgi:RNA polymerase sigma-70 factor (ECF subfamily)